MLYQNDGVYSNFVNNITEKEGRIAELILALPLKKSSERQ
jgi:hypothetical protein